MREKAKRMHTNPPIHIFFLSVYRLFQRQCLEIETTTDIEWRVVSVLQLIRG